MKSKIIILAVLFLAVSAVNSISVAQQADGNITAQTEIVGAITVSGAQDLLFPTIFTGTTEAQTVLATEDNAGRFDVTGTANASVSVEFVLPSVLAGSNSNELPIAFSETGTDFGLHNTTNSQTGGTSFDPTSVTTVSLGAGNLYIFLGGQITPVGSEPADTYTGEITLTVEYSNI